MALTVDNTKRDGDLCVALFTVTSGGGNVTTTENVVGHIKQIAVTNDTGISHSFAFTLEDTANGMQLYSGNLDSDDILPDSFNGGSGAYCRGPLKGTAAATGVVRTIEVFYEKI